MNAHSSSHIASHTNLQSPGSPLIRLSDVAKSFVHAGGRFQAVSNVSLEIFRGEIFGIMGQSGAGKSTLLRTINLLEPPDSGSVWVDGVDITSLDKHGLRQKRRSIGMIFQQFNLLQNASVFDNVAFPLRLRGAARDVIEARVTKCLAIVGLADKTSSYPSQLSGGQKQRVAIARALATEPAVMLCDEPTSALDAETAQSVLEVLRDINQRLGVTIVIVTHQIDVVRSLCHRLAEMRDGRIVRQSDIEPAQRVVARASLENQVMLDLDRSAVIAAHRELHVSSALKLVGG
jgi:D-methionine transport system ATP-binding protein